MVQAIIIEDESLAAQRLEAMLKKLDPLLHIAAKLSSVAASVAWLREHSAPDLIFMDIHLDDGASFAIFERVEVTAPVIFTTAYDAYTLQAFKVNSIDYLLKPINSEELAHALAQFRQLQLASYHLNPGVEPTVDGLRKTQLKSRFLVTAGSRVQSVPVEDVAYFYSESKITFLQTVRQQRYTIDFSLDRLMTVLDPSRFFRINRQLIVGIHAIGAMHKMSANRLKLTLDPAFAKDIYVSIDKYGPFKDWLDT